MTVDTTSSDLAEIIGAADPARIRAAVDRLRDELDAGRTIELSLRDVLLDSTSEERVALLRLLRAPAVEEAEHVAEVRRDAGQRFLDGDASAIYDAIPELCRDDAEDDDLYVA